MSRTGHTSPRVGVSPVKRRLGVRRPAACCSIALPEMAVAPVATQVVSGGAGRGRRWRYAGTGARGGESRQPSCSSRGSHMRSRWSCSRWSASSSRCSPSPTAEPVGTGGGSSDPLTVESHGPFTSVALNVDDAFALTVAGDAICWSIGDSRVSDLRIRPVHIHRERRRSDMRSDDGPRDSVLGPCGTSDSRV